MYKNPYEIWLCDLISVSLTLDGCFPFLQPVHKKRGEGREDAEDDEDPADRGGEEDGNVVARKGEASPKAAFADRP